MTKKSIKSESLKRLRAIMEEYKTDEELYSSKSYRNLQHFLNQYEKDNVEDMVAMIRDGYTNQQIIKSINEKNKAETIKDQKKEKPTVQNDTDPVAKATEQIFVGYHLADGPVSVEIETDKTDVASTDQSSTDSSDSVDEANKTDDQSDHIYIISNDPAVNKTKELKKDEGTSEHVHTTSEDVQEKKKGWDVGGCEVYIVSDDPAVNKSKTSVKSETPSESEEDPYPSVRTFEDWLDLKLNQFESCLEGLKSAAASKK